MMKWCEKPLRAAVLFLAIGSGLFALLHSVVRFGSRPAKVAAAHAVLERMSNGIERYYADCGVLPRSSDLWPVLMTNKNSDMCWRGPYINSSPFDSWGRPCKMLLRTHDNGAVDMVLYSLGENGVDEEGVGDDIALVLPWHAMRR